QRRGMDSPSCTSLFSCGFFVAVAAMVAAAAVSLLPGLGGPQTALPASGRVALVVMVMSLAFSGVLLSTLLNLPDARRVRLVVLVFGGEWNEFARRSVYAVCAIAFIVSAGTLLAGLFQVGAAIV